MTTLYHRATPRQDRVLRMIEGAVRNAAHAHPDMSFDPRLVKSIAKRAAGTLTAGWPDVLAAPRGRSDSGGDHARTSVHGEPTLIGNRRVEAPHVSWRLPLLLLKKILGEAAGRARRQQEIARFEAMVDVLRLINRMAKAEGLPTKNDRHTIS